MGAVLDMAADRGAYIDQSQSLNIHMIDATAAKLSSMHFHGWKVGLKTGMYYLRTKAATDAIKFTVDVEQVKRASQTSSAGRLSEDKVDAAALEAAQVKKLNPDTPFNCVNCSG